MEFQKFNQYIRRSRGVSAIEFAIILPAYLLFILGIIELGYILWGSVSLQYAASYGARYAYVNPTATSQEIDNFALSTINFPGDAITFDVSISGRVADINGTFSFTPLYIPIKPLTINTQVVQNLPGIT